MGQELLETWSIVLVLDLLCAVTGIEIILEFTSVIDLVERIGLFAAYLAITIEVGCRLFIMPVQVGSFRSCGGDIHWIFHLARGLNGSVLQTVICTVGILI